MSAAPELQYVSVDAYLAGELESPVKHEYVGGIVYAIAGAKNVHNLIAGNVFGVLHAKLRGSACRPYNSDTKIRVNLPNQVRFYYPDVSVVCDPNPPDDSFQDRPVVIVEVLSNKTQRIDQGEKRDAYLTIPSLQAYLLVQQGRISVAAVIRREQGFVEESYASLSDVIPLACIRTELALSEVYESVELTPEAADEE